MKFLLDESAEFPLAEYLRAKGHEVTAIAHDYPHALTDSEVLAIGLDEARIIITNDRDFGELIFRQGYSHNGIIFFRLKDVPVEVKMEWLDFILVNHTDDLHHFLVVSRQGIRIRRSPEL